jgi:hypothetical protein
VGKWDEHRFAGEPPAVDPDDAEDIVFDDPVRMALTHGADRPVLPDGGGDGIVLGPDSVVRGHREPAGVVGRGPAAAEPARATQAFDAVAAKTADAVAAAGPRRYLTNLFDDDPGAAGTQPATPAEQPMRLSASDEPFQTAEPGLRAGADRSAAAAGTLSADVEGAVAPGGGWWKSMPGEGNCMFHALAELLGMDDPAAHEDLRAAVVEGLYRRADEGWDGHFADFPAGEPQRRAQFQQQLANLLSDGEFRDAAAEFFLPHIVRELELNVDVRFPAGATRHLRYGPPGGPVSTLLRATGDGAGHYWVGVDEGGIALGRAPVGREPAAFPLRAGGQSQSIQGTAGGAGDRVVRPGSRPEDEVISGPSDAQHPAWRPDPDRFQRGLRTLGGSAASAAMLENWSASPLADRLPSVADRLGIAQVSPAGFRESGDQYDRGARIWWSGPSGEGSAHAEGSGVFRVAETGKLISAAELGRTFTDHDLILRRVSAGPGSAPARAGRGRPAPPESGTSRARSVSDYRLVTRHTDESIAAMSAEQRLRRAPFVSRDAREFEIVTVPDSGTVVSFPHFRAVRPVVTSRPGALRVSGDGSIALNTDKNAVKEFYAIPEVVEKASTTLAQAISNVGLSVDHDTYVEFDQDGETRRLFRVTPTFRDRPTDVCRDFSEQVLGAQFTHMVLFDTRHKSLGGTGAVTTARIETHSGVEVSGTHHLVDYLTKAADNPQLHPMTPTAAAAAAGRAADEFEFDWPMPGRSYTSARDPAANQHRNQALSAAESALGLNAKAFAKPMEAYLCQSIASQHDARGERDIPGTHGYHFATVVLESADGQHQITIENTNYRSAIRNKLDEVLDLNLAHYRDHVDEIHARLDAAIANGDIGADDHRVTLVASMRKIWGQERDLADLTHTITQASIVTEAMSREHDSHNGDLAAARRDAKRSLTGILGEELGHNGDMWHFAMYGRAPDESFFGTRSPADQAHSLAAVVLAGHGDQRQELGFAAGGVALDPAQRGRLERMAATVARVAAWRHGEGLPPPRVDLTVKSGLGERKLAVARGEVVKEYFLGCLRDRLVGLDRPDAAVDIEVTVRRGRVPPQRIRDGVGEVETDGRSGVVLTYDAESDPAGAPPEILSTV